LRSRNHCSDLRQTWCVANRQAPTAAVQFQQGQVDVSRFRSALDRRRYNLRNSFVQRVRARLRWRRSPRAGGASDAWETCVEGSLAGYVALTPLYKKRRNARKCPCCAPVPRNPKMGTKTLSSAPLARAAPPSARPFARLIGLAPARSLLRCALSLHFVALSMRGNSRPISAVPSQRAGTTQCFARSRITAATSVSLSRVSPTPPA
jgi:hypothetical protein